MEVETEMAQPLVTVCLKRPTHLVRRADHKRGAAMPNAGHVAEHTDRRELVEDAGRGGRRLKVDPCPVEVKDLVQARLGLVPGLLARLGQMYANRDRRDLALCPVVPELDEQLLVSGMPAPGARRQVIP